MLLQFLVTDDDVGGASVPQTRLDCTGPSLDGGWIISAGEALRVTHGVSVGPVTVSVRVEYQHVSLMLL